MVEASPFPGNQLLFNLSNGLVPTTMSTKFNAPRAIVIEKIPVAATPQRGFGPAMHQFTAISEDSMSRAMDLVRNDLKKKKLDFVSLSPTRSRSRSTATKIIRSRTYHDKLKKRQGRQSPVLTVKEKQCRKPSRTAVIQTDRFAAEIGRKYNLANLPARSMSPPTRDIPTTHEDKVLGEICRLQREMTKCLQQMRFIREKRNLQPRGINVRTPVYAEDMEEQRKRKIRSEERATRSARTIYMLMQQTNKLHEEIRKLDTAMKIDTKKGQLTSRLAALHRGVVRALQMLVQQMSDGDDDHHSVARDYRDLAIIIRQLSMCCAQLEVTNESSLAQEDLLNLLRDVAELNEIVEKVDPPPSSPPRPCRTAFEEVVKKKSQFSRRPAQSDSSSTVYRNPIQKVRVRLDEFGENIHKDAYNVEQRKAALSSGLQKLLKNNSVSICEPLPVRAPKLNAQRQKKKFRVCCHAKNHSRKGVLLARQNKGSSCGCGHWSRADDYEHYAVPTISTIQKRPEVRRRRSKSPARATPSPSALETSWHFAEPTFSKSQKEVSVSRDGSRSSSRSTTPQLTPRRVRSSQSPATHDSSWRRSMEKDVRTKIEPLLKSGQIAADVNKVTDEIIGDLMADMASELHGRREENRATYQAAVLRDAPDVETILQRLHQMEMEQDEIRLRWTSLAYGDLKSTTTGVTLNDEPDSPIPFEIIAGVKNGQAITSRQVMQINDSNAPIIFTKPRHKTTTRQGDFQIDKSTRDSGIVVSLQPEALYNIRQQVQNFETYLKRHINERVDLFDPWKVVEDIADDIVENCLLDVCSELEDINKDIVNHVYRSEFALDPAK